MFPTSGPNCIQTAYTVHTNCIQPIVCEGIVNTDGGFVLRPVRNLMLAAGSEKRSDTTESIIRPNQTWPTCAVVRPDPDATGMQNRHAPRGSHVLNPSNSTGLRSPCHVACMQSARERCEKAQNPVGSKTQTGFRPFPYALVCSVCTSLKRKKPKKGRTPKTTAYTAYNHIKSRLNLTPVYVPGFKPELHTNRIHGAYELHTNHCL